MTIVSSRNLFIDTSIDTNSSQGDDYVLQLGKNSITTNSGQQLKLTLTYFNMYRNYYTINETNNQIVVRSTFGGQSGMPTETGTIAIPPNNYPNLGTIVEAFAQQVKTELLAQAGRHNSVATASGTKVVYYTPSQNTPLDAGDRIMRFQIQFDHPHNITDLSMACYELQGEAYEVLGADRVQGNTDTTSSSFAISRDDATHITVFGYYPMQLSTDSHICLRTDLPNSNIETSSFMRGTGPHNYKSQTLSSNILAMIPQDTQFTNFTTATDNEYFLYSTVRNLTSMRLFLTDHRGRKLGRNEHNRGTGTAAGIGLYQSTLGNLSFRAVIRVDVIQALIPNTLQSEPFKPTVPARLTGVLNNLTCND